MTEQEGVVKYSLTYESADLMTAAMIQELNPWRKILFQLALIGQDPSRYGGLGFGNVSRRSGESNAFVVTGTQTGHLPDLDSSHYCLVTDCDTKNNHLLAKGSVKPSSEALTHAAFYQADTRINCVFHAHSPDIWNRAEELAIQTTPEHIAYGTPEMAQEVSRLLKEGRFSKNKILIMKGHKDGVISFGANEEEAGASLIYALAKAYQ